MIALIHKSVGSIENQHNHREDEQVNSDKQRKHRPYFPLQSFVLPQTIIKKSLSTVVSQDSPSPQTHSIGIKKQDHLHNQGRGMDSQYDPFSPRVQSTRRGNHAQLHPHPPAHLPNQSPFQSPSHPQHTPPDRYEPSGRQGKEFRIHGKKALVGGINLPALRNGPQSPSSGTSTTGFHSGSVVSYDSSAPSLSLAEKMRFNLSSLAKMSASTKDYIDGLLVECAQVQIIQERNQHLEEKVVLLEQTVKKLQETVLQLSSQKQQLNTLYHQEQSVKKLNSPAIHHAEELLMRSHRSNSNSPPRRNHFSVVSTVNHSPDEWMKVAPVSSHVQGADIFASQIINLSALLVPCVLNPQQSIVTMKNYLLEIFGAESVVVYFLDQSGQKLIHNPFLSEVQDTITPSEGKDTSISWNVIKTESIFSYSVGDKHSESQFRAMYNSAIDSHLPPKTPFKNILACPFLIEDIGNTRCNGRAVCLITNRNSTITAKVAESLLAAILSHAKIHLSVCIRLDHQDSLGAFGADDVVQSQPSTPDVMERTSKTNRSYVDMTVSASTNKLLLEMARDITNELDLISLLRVMMQHAKELVMADRCSVFLVDNSRNEIVSKLAEGVEEELRFPKNTGIAGLVATSGECVVVNDAQNDARFNAAVDKQTGYRTNTILCVPIFNNGEIVGVAQMINKKAGMFTSNDQRLLSTFSVFCGVGIRNATLYAEALKQEKRSKSLLAVAIALSSSDDMNSLVKMIMSQAQSLVDAERFCLFEVDKEEGVLRSRIAQEQDTIVVPLNKGFVGHVAKTQECLIVDNAYEDSRFHGEIDKITGFQTRTLMCVPVLGRSGEVIGIVEMMNKKSGGKFKKEDLELLKAFSTFCAMPLEPKHEADSKIHRLMPAPTGNFELDHLRMAHIVSTESIEALGRLDFKCWEYTHEELIGFIVYMFKDLGLIERYNISELNLFRFVRSCQKVYRNDVPYHNFIHAFDVTHCTYLFLKLGNITRFLKHLDILGLMVASVCHDLDHRGTNNLFQVRIKSPIAILYNNASVMENHHCAEAITILSSPENSLFDSLDEASYGEVYNVIISSILATDMASHFDFVSKFDQLVKANNYSIEAEDHRRLLFDILMKCSDISNIAKPFPIARRWADVVSDEFFRQGDLEKKNNFPVTPIMDREKVFLPQMQAGFINAIGIPTFTLLSTLIPELDAFRQNVCLNRDQYVLLSSQETQPQPNNTDK